MKITKLLSIVSLTCVMVGGTGQTTTLELTFTAIDSAAYVQLDSIKVMNRTQGGDTVLYWPDTVLVLDFPTGIPDFRIEDRGFKVFQNYPNPVTEQTTISLYVPEKDRVILNVSDMLGRILLKTERMLDKGMHSFRFTPGKGNLYFFTALWRGQRSSIKILCAGYGSAGTVTLEYSGRKPTTPQLKVSETIQGFSFSPGDELLYIGYSDTLESGIPDRPEQNQTYTFQFATNIPCPGTPTVEYEGQVYNTIQIFSQCWLKENLNVGTMIDGNQYQTNNSIIERYCYNNEPDSCTRYGGLYQWDEMMQYSTQQGVQGICPPGWHLPTDEEWKVLEGAVDSQYRIGDSEWDLYWEYRGYDAGTNLKATSGWNYNGNGTDLFGFSGLPGGYRVTGGYPLGYFGYAGSYATWWTSEDLGTYYARSRVIDYFNPGVYRNLYDYFTMYDTKDNGFSVRCLRD